MLATGLIAGGTAQCAAAPACTRHLAQARLQHSSLVWPARAVHCALSQAAGRAEPGWAPGCSSRAMASLRLACSSTVVYLWKKHATRLLPSNLPRACDVHPNAQFLHKHQGPPPAAALTKSRAAGGRRSTASAWRSAGGDHAGRSCSACPSGSRQARSPGPIGGSECSKLTHHTSFPFHSILWRWRAGSDLLD